MISTSHHQPRPYDAILGGHSMESQFLKTLKPNDVLLFEDNETYLVHSYQEKVKQNIANTLSGDLYESLKKIRDKANTQLRGSSTTGKVELNSVSEEISCRTLQADANNQGWQGGILKIRVETAFSFAAPHYDVNFEVQVFLEFCPNRE